MITAPRRSTYEKILNVTRFLQNISFVLRKLQGLQSKLTAPSVVNDIEDVSGDLGTSLTESFNHIAIMFAPKDHYFSEQGHDMRSKLAVLHHNGAR